MKKEMLINVLQPEECRIAILEDGVLEELYVERTSHESYVGNIYKGRIVNIEPSIQAAFVDFGVGRNGFLHVSDVEQAYYRHLEQNRSEGRGGGGRRGNGRDRPRRSRSGEDEDTMRPRRPSALSPEAEAYVEAEAERPLDLPEEALSFLAPEIVGAPEADDPVASPPPAEPEPVRERRRTRGGSRRRREEPSSPRSGRAEAKAPPATDAPAREEPLSEPAPQSAEPSPETAPSATHEEPAKDAPPPKPQVMESAERRTEEEDSAEPLAPLSPLDDADLFFPRSDPTPTPAFAEEEREPEPEYEPEPEPEPLIQQDLFLPLEPPAEELEAPHTDDFDDDEFAEEMAEQRLPEFDEAEEDEPRRRSRGRAGSDRREGPDGRRGGRPGRRGGPGRMGFGRPKPLIQDIFRRGQEVLVQVIKEGIGTKGPTLSTYISIAGRYLVLMPGLNRVGVSRKIGDDEQRRRLREIFHELKPPKGIGFIIRTAGMDRNKKELQGDLNYLSRLWQVVVRRIRKSKAPTLIYEESDMITRTIRDTFTSDIDTIWVDEPHAFEHAQEFLQIVMPRYANRIKLYEGTEPLYHKYKIEDEIARIQLRHVPLPHGGSIVIEQTEALVAIDVNSGNFRADNNAEETAYQMNLHAAKEIARQLRLRDLGGVIVNDFIDMRDEKHRRNVERAVRDAVKRDRARTKILKISAFGIIEMTRQRIRPSLKRSVYQDCKHCVGTGQVKTCESMSIDVMRMIQLAAHREPIFRIEVQVADDVANYLLNKKRKEISKLEESGEIQVQITGLTGVAPERLDFVCYDKNNNEVKFLSYEDSRSGRR